MHYSFTSNGRQRRLTTNCLFNAVSLNRDKNTVQNNKFTCNVCLLYGVPSMCYHVCVPICHTTYHIVVAQCRISHVLRQLCHPPHTFLPQTSKQTMMVMCHQLRHNFSCPYQNQECHLDCVVDYIPASWLSRPDLSSASVFLVKWLSGEWMTFTH